MVSVLRPGPRPIELHAADGFVLGGHVVEPRRPRETLVIHGATAVPSTYYHAFAERAAAAGFRVLTYDYRGVGASRPASLRGFDATMTQWAELDARAAMAWAGEGASIVGHSFGGQAIGLVDEMRRARRALLVGAQLGHWRHWPARSWPKLLLFWYGIVPVGTRVAGYLPDSFGLGEALPAGVAREWGRWCRDPDYLVGARPDAAARFARFDVPTRLYAFTDDDFAPPAAVDALVARLHGAPLEHRTIAPADVGLPAIGHFGFFRPRAAALWPDALRFLAGEIAPRPWIGVDEITADLMHGRD